MSVNKIGILLVEDNRGDARLIAESLRTVDSGEFTLATVDRLDAALQHLQQHSVDALLLDLGLPDSHGLAGLQRVRQAQPALPVVVLTGLDDEKTGLEAVAMGAQDYLVKGESDGRLLGRVLRYAIERQQAEESTRAAQQLAQTTIDSLNNHICVLDAQGEIMAVNKSWLEFSTANDGDAALTGVGVNYLEVCDQTEGDEQAMAARFAAGIRAVMAAEADEFALEYPCHSPEEQRWFIARVTPLRVKGSGQRPVVINHENITGRKLAEQRLRLRSAALEAAANAVVITDKAGKIEWVNPAFTTLTGYSLTEAFGKGPGHLIGSGKHDAAFYQEMWDTILSGKVWRGELINRRRDGTRYLEEQTITPVRNEMGQITHFIGIKQDISQRKQAEAERMRLLEQVQRQAQRIRQIINTVPEGVVLFDGQGNVLLANPAAIENLKQMVDYQPGLPVTQLCQRPLADFFTPALSSTIWQEVSCANHIFAITAHPVAATDSTPEEQWVMVISDITQQKEIQRQAQAQEKLAVVGQLAAGIAHDFNNIMGVISIYAELLQEKPDLSITERRQLETIYIQSNHAVNLVQQILDFSRRSLLEKISLDLALLVKEMVKMLERTLPENIQIQLTYEENQYIVLGDPTRLQQVMMNLALNARDAMPHGGNLTITMATLETKMADLPIASMMTECWLQLRVTDTGEGIAAEHRDHIFEPFFTTKKPGQGTGLGLAQVYGIIKQHHGFIDMETAVGRGTAFTVYLPLQPNQESAAPLASLMTGLPTGSETILLVEDNLAMRFSLADALHRLEYRVLTAANGKEAFALLEGLHREVDLVLTDWVMPDVDGPTLIAQVQQAYPDIKLLIATGYPLQKSDDKLPASMLVKPFDLTTLAHELRAIFDSNATNEGENDASKET